MARFLLIKQDSDGVFLYRFAEDGTCVGDTRHVGVDEAQEQARSEYGGMLSDWTSVPETVNDEMEFARETLK